ncbi:MAG: hypothetical protein ACKOCC_07015 [Actinomycetota bacterium]
MFRRALDGLDARRWFDRMWPQTLAIAVWLLYIDGVFNLLAILDRRDIWGMWRVEGGPGALVAFVALLAYPAGGFLMANGKLLGWWVALGAAVAPWILRIWWKVGVWPEVSLEWVIVGGSYVNLMFEAALVALLVHPMSRNHARTWFR